MRQIELEGGAPRGSRLKRLAIIAGVGFVFGVIFLVAAWNAFFTYVPPGKHLVITTKSGEPLKEGQVLAEKDQQGIQRVVLGEGWHFVMPIANAVEVEDNTVIPPGHVGIVKARGGKTPANGRILAEEGERGIQRLVLPPGVYRLNLHGYEVEKADAVEIKAGFVGVQRRLLGTDGPTRFAEKAEEKGILKELLQPGLYYVNMKEYEIIMEEVGVFQTTFHAPTKDNPKDTSIEFTCKGGFKIKLDCTVEWEVVPQDMPLVVAEFKTWNKVEEIAINQQAQAIARDKGAKYGVQDLLEGSKRQEYQEDFTDELRRRSKANNVVVHSAYIRNIVIPDIYMKEIRDRQIAVEANLTNKAKAETAKSDADVQKAKSMIEQRVKEVEYETERMVAVVDNEVTNIGVKAEAEIEKTSSEYKAKIAELNSQKTKVLGTAKSEVVKLKETAENGLYQMQMDAFQNDGNAYLRYKLAEKLNPDLKLRLFHSGPGTFWTNLDAKNMNLLLPAPGSDKTVEKVAGTGKKD